MTVVAGGGGGAGGGTSSGWEGAGGGGGAVFTCILDFTKQDTFYIHVGKGGAAGAKNAVGGDGESSWVNYDNQTPLPRRDTTAPQSSRYGIIAGGGHGGGTGSGSANSLKNAGYGGIVEMGNSTEYAGESRGMYLLAYATGGKGGGNASGDSTTAGNAVASGEGANVNKSQRYACGGSMASSTSYYVCSTASSQRTAGNRGGSYGLGGGGSCGIGGDGGAAYQSGYTALLGGGGGGGAWIWPGGSAGG